MSIKISTGAWGTVWSSLVEGRLDVLPIVAKMPERQHLVDFSLPHTETYDAFFVRKRDIILQFLLESSFISVSGGIIGMAAGFLMTGSR